MYLLNSMRTEWDRLVAELSKLRPPNITSNMQCDDSRMPQSEWNTRSISKLGKVC